MTIYVAYFLIIIQVMFAPLLLIGEIIPGKSAFMPWLRNLVGNLAVFPMIVIIFMLASYIASFEGYNNASFWNAPFMNIDATNARGFAAIVAISLIFLIPNFAMMIKKAMGAETGLPLSSLSVLLSGLALMRPLNNIRAFGANKFKEIYREKFPGLKKFTVISEIAATGKSSLLDKENEEKKREEWMKNFTSGTPPKSGNKQ